MRFRFFSVPVNDSQAAEAELNAFLASQRVLAVERALVCRFIHPEHFQKRRKCLAKNSYRSESNAALKEGVGLDEHVGARDQSRTLRSESPESYLGLLVSFVGTDEERQQCGGVDENSAHSKDAAK